MRNFEDSMSRSSFLLWCFLPLPVGARVLESGDHSRIKFNMTYYDRMVSCHESKPTTPFPEALPGEFLLGGATATSPRKPGRQA